jgi:hypothetical protein
MIKVVAAPGCNDIDLARDFREHFLFFDGHAPRGRPSQVDSYARWIADHDP